MTFIFFGWEQRGRVHRIRRGVTVLYTEKGQNLELTEREGTKEKMRDFCGMFYEGKGWEDAKKGVNVGWGRGGVNNVRPSRSQIHSP